MINRHSGVKEDNIKDIIK